MDELVAEMVLTAKFDDVKRAIEGLLRDGVLATEEEYSKLANPLYEVGWLDPIQVMHFTMREQPTLSTEDRAVWCVGYSAIVAEPMPGCRGESRTVMRLLAVKGIVYIDFRANNDWSLLVLQFLRWGLITCEECKHMVSTRKITDYPLDLVLRSIEYNMLKGEMPTLPKEEDFKQYWPVLVGNGGMTEDDAKEEVDYQWAELKEMFDEELPTAPEMPNAKEIQRMKDYSVEEATAMYFAEPNDKVEDASNNGQPSQDRDGHFRAAGWSKGSASEFRASLQVFSSMYSRVRGFAPFIVGDDGSLSISDGSAAHAEIVLEEKKGCTTHNVYSNESWHWQAILPIWDEFNYWCEHGRLININIGEGVIDRNAERNMEIVKKFQSGKTDDELAREYNLSRDQIGNIRDRYGCKAFSRKKKKNGKGTK